MKALWQIILQFLWRLRPVQALEVNLRDAITAGLALFADDLELEALATDRTYRQTIAAALFDAHRKLDLLIYHRACELAGVTTHLGFKPDYSWTHSSTDVIALWKSFHRFLEKFDDYERYAIKRAERLKREDTTICPSLRNSPDCLEATHHATAFAGSALATDTALSVLPRRRRGRWIARTRAQDGRGCALARGSALARGPPLTPRNHTLPTVHRLSASRLRSRPHIRNIPKSSSHIARAVAHAKKTGLSPTP
ncbi:MAG: hypothetical protein EOP61_15570 [Sphingomonadales bacterium]|nr:MAG: hypothetical protein EOP61_15570 [Sphingomonadales bacterium]